MLIFSADRKGKVNLSAGGERMPVIRMIQQQPAADREDVNKYITDREA